MSRGILGEKNPMWKGKNVGYGSLHTWVKKRVKPKPEFCECCGKVPPYDLANKGVYDRNPDNWEWLCRRCHMKKDGRLEKIRDIISKYQEENKMTPEEKKASRYKIRKNWEAKNPTWHVDYYWKNEGFREKKRAKWREWYQKNKVKLKEKRDALTRQRRLSKVSSNLP